MGHALDNTLQDILTRFKRMQGYEALWLPGTDHASIATEAKVVEALKNISVRMISYGGSNHNISLLVKTEDKVRALRALSKAIF